jgi:hypothetical protein
VYPLRSYHQENLSLVNRDTLKTEQNAFYPNLVTQLAIKPSTISTALLKASQPLHMPPINLVVYQGSYLLAEWVT